MQKNFPSVKRIASELNTDDKTAGKVRALMTASRSDIYDMFPGIADYARRCYNPPSLYYVRMLAIDCTIDTCGVEGAEVKPGKYIDYCNTGDTYIPTICYFEGRFIVSSWGDIVEKYM